MSRTIADLQEATIIDDQDEILFYQNSTKKTKKVKRGNFFSSRGIVVQGKFIDSEGNDVGLSAAAAANDAATALVTAQGAQDTADGKNRIFYADTAPTNPIGDYNLRENDIWFETDNGYKMSKWNGSSWEAYELDDQALAGLNVGKLTAGFISSQVISILGNTADSTQPAQCSGFIESNNFIPTWVSGIMTVRVYNAGLSQLGKSSASDVVQVKVLQDDGKYKLFRSKVDQGDNATGAPPSSGENTYWIEVPEASIPTITLDIGNGITKTVQNFGFRIVANGYAEFGGSLFRGAIIANEGYFGDKVNAVRIDDEGMVMGNFGRVKTAGIGYNGTDFTSTAGSGGFFLGNTQAEGQEELYQFFIGDPSGNWMRWNGTDLRVNAKVVGIGTGGLADPDAEYGVTIGSQYGIRRSVNSGTLTLSGGNENGIQRGAQIDLAGTQLDTSASDTGNGILALQAGYNSAYEFNGPRDGSIEFRTSLGVDNGDGADLGVLRMRIDLDGQVNIFAGQTVAGDAPDAGAGKLVVDDSVTSGSYNATSSKRFKKKIKNLKNGLSIVSSLRPVTFDWKKKDKKNDIGLIAEEVYQVLPSVVSLDKEGKPYALDYSKLTSVLIQAVKELSGEIERLKNKIG